MKTRRSAKKQKGKGTEEEKDVDPESARGNSDDSDGGAFVPKEEGEESEDKKESNHPISPWDSHIFLRSLVHAN